MPLNLVKEYPELLTLLGSPEENKRSLRRIFDRDIANQTNFCFRGIRIHPIKAEGVDSMDTLFTHLTCKAEEVEVTGRSSYKHRVFDRLRSERLHWIAHHINERSPQSIQIFTLQERDQKKREDVTKTYIYDQTEEYVIILEHQRASGYYLLTAFHITEASVQRQIKKKMLKAQKRATC